MNKINLFLIALALLLISCNNESPNEENSTLETEQTEDNKTEISDVDISDFEYSTDANFFFLEYLKLGITLDECKMYVGQYLDDTNLEETEDGLRNKWSNEPNIDHQLSLGTYMGSTLEHLAYRIDFATEESLLLQNDYFDKVLAQLKKTYGKYTSESPEGENVAKIWETENEGIILDRSLNAIILQINYAYPPDTEAFDEEENGEWIQVGEDGRWVFIPKE